MIPTTNNDINLVTFSPQEMTSRTYDLDIDTGHVMNFTDKREAMKRVIYLVLSTERYKYPIYSWNYGVELDDLFGQPIPYVLPELKRRVTEALLMDDRITAVDGWQFEVKRQKVHATFTVSTIFGDVEAETEVNI